MKLIAIFIASTCLGQLSVERFFGNNYANALAEMDRQEQTVTKIANAYVVNVDLVKCIVFPELIRNSVFAGMVEEQTLALAYVQFGSDAVDFSIGKFQIKPSFANKIEDLVRSQTSLKSKYKNILIAQKDLASQRMVRVERLKKVEWQTRYVCCFIEYCIEKYELEELSTTEKIKFLATAFNVGLKSTRESIEKMYDLRAFPYGSKFGIEQVNYWEVSINYYLKQCKSVKVEV